MKLNGNDEPLLTAFALGELDGADRARVAAYVERDAEAREFVENVRETAGALAAGLRAESAGLLPIQREAIEQRLRPSRGAAASPSRVRRWLPMAASVAASVAIVGGVIAFLLPRLPLQPSRTTNVEQSDGAATRTAPGVERADQPLLPGSRAPGELANREVVAPRDELPGPDAHRIWVPVEPIDDEPPTDVAHAPPAPVPAPAKDERGSPIDARPTAPEQVKGPDGPARSPEAEDVRPGGGGNPRSGLPPNAHANRDPRLRPPADVTKLLPPAERDALERIVKSTQSSTQPRIYENPFRLASQRGRSSFPVRVETSSYQVMQSHLLERKLPPAHRVRIEELLNRFAYRDAPPPQDGPPIAAYVEVATCPWDISHRLARVAIKAREGGATVVARGVEVSVEFNPLTSGSWRLIGYENAPPPANQAAANPTMDLGAGAAATALYEIVPTAHDPRLTASRDLFTATVRFRDPLDAGAVQNKLEVVATDLGKGFDRASEDFRFTCAVAAMGMILRDSQFKGTATFPDVIRWATAGKGPDETRERAAFIDLARAARDAAR